MFSSKMINIMFSGTMTAGFILVIGLETSKMGGRKGMELISFLVNSYSKVIFLKEREMGLVFKKSMKKKLTPYQYVKILKTLKIFHYTRDIGRTIKNMGRENLLINMEFRIQDSGSITFGMVMVN